MCARSVPPSDTNSITHRCKSIAATYHSTIAHGEQTDDEAGDAIPNNWLIPAWDTNVKFKDIALRSKTAAMCDKQN